MRRFTDPSPEEGSRSMNLRRCILLVSALCLLGPPQLLRSQIPDPPSPVTLDARTPPPWLEKAVIYEIFPESFSPAGNFAGVTSKLDDLQKLGVNVLWLMPIHPMGQYKKKGTLGSPYSVRDFYAINPAYGTKDDLHHLIDEAHHRQMKVILDIVANHTSFDSVMIAHPAFYKRDAQGNILYPHNWTDVAKLDYTNPELRKYMTDMLLYWVRDFHVDGFRCDAAGEVPTDFWESARIALDRLQPGLLLLAEASQPDLLKSAFDIDYSWPLMAALNQVIEHGQPATSIEQTLKQQDHLFPKHAQHMRMFDDHDEQRALARYGILGSLAAAALIFTLDGVPMIYNGMEVSDPTESGAPALFEPLKIYWQAGEMRPEFPAFYHFIIPFREQHPALLHGATTWLHNSDEAHIVTYLRVSGEEHILVAINLSNTPFRGTVEIAPNTWQEIALPTSHHHADTGVTATPAATAPQSALPALSLNAFQFRLFELSTH